MPKTAATIHLTDQDAATLRRWARSSSIRAGLAQRARIVLAAAEGLTNTPDRRADRLLAAHGDPLARPVCRQGAGRAGRPARSGRRRTVRRHRRAEIVAITQQPPPQQLGNHPLVDPHPGQAPGRQPQVLGRCFPRHRHDEFLVFLKQVARAWPRRKLHVVCDNASAHKHAEVTAWLARHPRISLHLTPTSASWMSQVETFFGLLTRQAVRRGSFTSVPDLVAAIGRYIRRVERRLPPILLGQGRRRDPGQGGLRSRPARPA